MKKIFLFIFVSIFTLPNFSQTDSLYVDGMTWVTGYYEFYSENTPQSRLVYYRYTINGDTVINDVKYKKMIYSYRSVVGTSEIYWKTYFVRYEKGRYLQYLPWDKSYMGESYFIGDDFIFFDENLKQDDWLIGRYPYEKIDFVADTVFDYSSDKLRRYWKLLPYASSSMLYTDILDNVLWVEGIGSLSKPIPQHIDEVDCPCYQMLLFCINSVGDTIYKNSKYLELNPILQITEVSVIQTSFKQMDDKFIVVLSTDVPIWSAALYNSNGIKVAHKSGSGNEIILPTTSEGTHVLAIKADGKLIEKKVFIK